MKPLSTREKRILGALALLTMGGVVAWSAGWVDRPPLPIRSALHALSANQFPEAIAALEHGSGLGPCTSGTYGTPADDLAEPLLVVDLAQVQLTRSLAAEPVGSAATPSKEADLAARCARSAAQIVVRNRDFPRALRARAAALAGHAAFVLGDNESAIANYDIALALGDGGREATEDAAWNRSLALKRLQSASDPPDSGAGGGGDDGGANDGGSDGGPDSGDGGDGGEDAGRDGGNDGGVADAATDSAAGTSDQAVLERLGNLPRFPTTLRRDPSGARVLPGAEDK